MAKKSFDSGDLKKTSTLLKDELDLISQVADKISDKKTREKIKKAVVRPSKELLADARDEVSKNLDLIKKGEVIIREGDQEKEAKYYFNILNLLDKQLLYLGIKYFQKKDYLGLTDELKKLLTLRKVNDVLIGIRLNEVLSHEERKGTLIEYSGGKYKYFRDYCRVELNIDPGNAYRLAKIVRNFPPVKLVGIDMSKMYLASKLIDNPNISEKEQKSINNKIIDIVSQSSYREAGEKIKELSQSYGLADDKNVQIDLVDKIMKNITKSKLTEEEFKQLIINLEIYYKENYNKV